VTRITAIKPQRNKKRVNVYLDGEFGFGIDLDNFVKLGLKVGQELSGEEVDEVSGKAEFQKFLDRLLNFATLRPRSRSEINGWMKRKKVPAGLHKGLFEKLEKLELVDDLKFTKWWVEQRNSFRPRPERVLKQELKIKGIEREIIEKVLSEVGVDEVKIAKDLIKKNSYRWEKYERFEKKRKMQEYLARKGFGWDVVKEVAGGVDNGAQD
jgi:regulatory protein